MSRLDTRVRPGETFTPRAGWYNTVSDAVQRYLRQQETQNQPATPPELFRPTLIQVQNNSGEDCDQFDILGLDDPLFDPTDSEVEFKASATFVGVTPVSGAHDGRFCILREPLGAGLIGEAVIAGLFKTTVDVVDVAHQYADVKDDDRVNLLSDWGGSARIVWKESGTGQKWALLLLGAGDVGTGEFIGQGLFTVAQNVRGWDFPTAYALPPL